MTMKLEMSDSYSNHSDYSCDSQSSQGSSTNDFISVPTSRSSLSLVPFTVISSEHDDSLMFATMFDYQNEDYSKPVLANLEGLHSGVPTRTTATITPTQLRSFEQTYIELTSCRQEPTHAGFVPPAVSHPNNYGILNQVGYVDSGPTTALHVSPGPMSASGDSMSSSPGLPPPKRRNMGGRRPTKTPQDLSPEEEERRKIRRERNKMAAARCRKRRMDHTNELQDETDKLEEKKQQLQEEIRKLNADRDQLTTILQAHMLTCRMAKRPASPPDVKPFHEPYPTYNPELTEDEVRVKVEVMDPAVDPTVDHTLALDSDIFPSPMQDKRIMLSAANPAVVTSGSPTLASSGTLDTPPAGPARPPRPSFLQVPTLPTPAMIHNTKNLGNKIPGIEISTPSNGIPFNFDSLMDGGTGLTPVHPQPFPLTHTTLQNHPSLSHSQCSQQTRAQPDVTSPDTPGSLVSL